MVGATAASGYGLAERVDWINVVTMHGADPTGLTDSAAAISAAIAAQAPGQVVYFPAGTYKVGSVIELAGYGIYLGSGKEQTVIQMAAGANLNAVLASAGWNGSAAATSVPPVTISGLTIDGNSSAQTGGAGHGLVLQTYRSTVTDCIFQNTTGDGLRFDTQGANLTTTISNTAVENRVERCQARSNGTVGFNVHDPGFNKLTDGFLEDCIVASPGLVTPGPAISVQAGAGWLIKGNHLYGSIPTSGILVSRPYMTRVVGNYVEAWGSSATSGTYSAVDFRAGFVNDGGNGSVISGNTVRFAATAGNAASVIYGVAVEAASSDLASISVTGNIVAAPAAPPANSIAIALICQNSASVVTVEAGGNVITGTWPGGTIVKGSTGTVHVLGELLPTAVKTGAYTASAGDLVPVDTTSGAVTITLPAAPPGRSQVSVRLVKGGNPVTVTCGGSDQFDDDAATSRTVSAVINQGYLWQYSATAARWYGVGSAVMLDATAGDIAASPGTAAAGSAGKAADAGHVHPSPPALAPAGLTGATAASRYAGATTSGAPASGTFAVGDFVVDRTGSLWICTAAGTPGTWAVATATIDATATDIQPLGTRAAGSVGKAADAGHVHPSTGALLRVADNGNAGTALINGTQTFCSWTAPADGNLHAVLVMCSIDVTSTATGGAIGYTFTDPDGNVRTNFQIIAGGQAAGEHLLGFTTVMVASGSTFSLGQTSALTGGAAKAFGRIYAD